MEPETAGQESPQDNNESSETTASVQEENVSESTEETAVEQVTFKQRMHNWMVAINDFFFKERMEIDPDKD